MSARYEPRGALAIEPSAFGLMLLEPYEPPPTVDVGGAAVVRVHGPLMQHHDAWCDSYAAILSRVREALASSPRALVLDIDSPGGVVSGLFSTATAIRDAARAAGVPLLAHVDGSACSAAYALACVASRVVVSPTALVGSVGVLEAMTDATAAAAQQGLRVTLVGSGSRKTDGSPMVATSPDATAAAKARVSAMAAVFFEHVAAHRPGLGADEVRALDAMIATGAEAVAVGLADAVGDLSTLLATVASVPSASAEAKEPIMDEEEKARAALNAIAEDEDRDEKDRARARRALAAMDDEDKDEPEGRAESDDEGEPEARASASVSAGTAGELATRLAQVERRLEAQERAEILAARPDITDSLRAFLATKPVAEVRALLGAIPAPTKPKLGDAAASAVVSGTRGDPKGAPRTPPAQSAAIQAAMGMTQTVPGVKREGSRLYLGAPVEKPTA